MPNTFLCYVKEKVKILQPNDKTVVLLVDEIHLQHFFDYKGSSVVGTASNSSEAAKSAFAFMISSIVSKYKDVVHVLPTCKINAKDLFALIQITIRGLEEVGFRVIFVITDNNAINRKAMSFYAEPLNERSFNVRDITTITSQSTFTVNALQLFVYSKANVPSNVSDYG